MGACLSQPQTASQQTTRPQKAHTPAHDSVRSVENTGAAAAAAAAAAAPGSKHSAASKKHGAGTSDRQRQPDQQRAGDTSGGRRPQTRDLLTGELLPDLGVHGVLDVVQELGSGGSGVTYLCRDLASSKVVAVKFVPRPLPRAAIPFLMGEVDIQAALGEAHLNMVTMHELMLTRSHLGLVMEYASGGSLTSSVSCLWESALSRGGLFMEEQEACFYLRQFMSALRVCHEHKVAHRDLKLDNTLLEGCLVGPPRLKICDFGFAKAWNASDNMKTAIGTPVYMSPQMLAARQCASGYSGIKADMWAAGVLLHVMLLGHFPFDHDSHEDPNSSEAAGEVWLKQQAGGWRGQPRAAEVLARGVLSAACCELLDGLLEMDEDKRLTTAQVLVHPWLQTPLNPEQQAAWERLEVEQAELTQRLQRESNPRLLKLRKEAMLAMMAVAAKPPGKTLLPHGRAADLGSAPSGGASQQQRQRQQQQQQAEAPGRVAGPATAAAAAPDVGSSSPPARGSGSDGGPAARRDASETHSDGATHHLSFQEGEGLRSGSLEAKVEAYRRQSAEVRAARLAAAITAAHAAEDSAAAVAASAASPLQPAPSGGSAHPSVDSIGSGGAAAGGAGGATSARQSAHSTASSASAVPPLRPPKLRGLFGKGRGSGGPRKSPFSSDAAQAQHSSHSSEHGRADDADEVWRLPLSSTADPAAYKLSPELAVAAGALVQQLQKAGSRVPGRGRANRSSCPMY